MKTSSLKIGQAYSDGKDAVRMIVGLEQMGKDATTPDRVRYSILAAKAEIFYDWESKTSKSVIGTESNCDLSSFAKWAKKLVPTDDLANLINELRAKKVRLSPSQRAFMSAVADEFEGVEFQAAAGTEVSFNQNELRAARGAEEKGLCTVGLGAPRTGGMVQLTELGAAWVRQSKAVPRSERAAA